IEGKYTPVNLENGECRIENLECRMRSNSIFYILYFTFLIIRFIKARCFFFGIILAFLLPWLVYGRSLWQGFAAIDDGFLIVNNPIVHGFDFWHIKLAFTTFDPELYIPATLMTFQLNWLMGGGTPFWFHFTNLLIQSINALLVAALLFSLSRRKGIAFVGAILFAIHPINTEAVVWAAGRKDLLCIFFLLIAYLAYRKYSSDRKVLYFILAISAFVLSLLAKAQAAILPAILVLDMILIQKRNDAKKMAAELLPFLALSVLFLWIASFGKEQILAFSSLYETFVMAQKSAAFYLLKLIFPSGLTVIYPFQDAIGLNEPAFFIPLLINAAIVSFAFWQRGKRPLIAFGILFFFASLVPTFFNFHKGELMFFAVDRYAYLPGIGVILALLLLGNGAADYFKISNVWKTSIVAAIVLMLGSVSVFQTRVWDTPDTLFGRSLELYPESVSARMAIGSILRERNLLADAFTVLHDGVSYSDHPGLNIEAGLVYSANGQVEDARQQFQTALKKNPKLAPADYYLGFLEADAGNDAGAIEWYEKAINHDPSYVTVRVHLADLLIKQKKYDEAGDQLTEALRWNPVSVEALEQRVRLAEIEKDKSLNYWS